MQYKILHQLDPQLFCAELLVFEKSAVMFEALYWLLFKVKTVSHLLSSAFYWCSFNHHCAGGLLKNKFNIVFQVWASVCI